MVYEAHPRRLRVETHIWQGDGFALTAARVFPRGGGTLDAGEEA
jgi:hypothetical protein